GGRISGDAVSSSRQLEGPRPSWLATPAELRRHGVAHGRMVSRILPAAVVRARADGESDRRLQATIGGRTMNGRRALVTGASGFIGRHLVDRLIAAGAQVLAMVRPG